MGIQGWIDGSCPNDGCGLYECVKFVSDDQLFGVSGEMMYIYSADKRFVIGCIEGGQEIMFTNPVPVWALGDD